MEIGRGKKTGDAVARTRSAGRAVSRERLPSHRIERWIQAIIFP
jgi:hypothetical protein